MALPAYPGLEVLLIYAPVIIFNVWDFWRGVNVYSQGFFGVLSFSPFDHPRHLKSRVPHNISILDTMMRK